MPGTLLIGYDVEGLVQEVREKWGDAYPHPEAVTQMFLAKAAEVHRCYQAPCTLFVLGEILERNERHFLPLRQDGLFDIEQHTYSHLRLKTVVENRDHGLNVYKGGTLDEIARDVSRASQTLRERLDLDCPGLCGPYGYYRGLSDRPDLLEVLHRLGIRFVRTYARNEHDWGPVSFDVQPFFYELQGFPDILEIPAQGWQDCHYRDSIGWKNVKGYIAYLESCLDRVAAQDLTWSVCLHDFSSIREDPDLSIVSELIQYAHQKQVRILSCKKYYQEARCPSQRNN